LLALGLDADIRSMLKTGQEDDKADPAQLLLWPERVRKTVADIDRAHVFVPSRGEYADLAATRITKTEVEEAGEYLITKGKESITVGEKLKRLAVIWVDPSAREYVFYCKHVIETAVDGEELYQHWESENELRDTLRVSVDDRRALRALLNAKLAELGHGPATS
jgi:hypothetical protein